MRARVEKRSVLGWNKSEFLLKDINSPALIQEWKLNPNAAEYAKNIDANLYKPSKIFNRHDSNLY